MTTVAFQMLKLINERKLLSFKDYCVINNLGFESHYPAFKYLIDNAFINVNDVTASLGSSPDITTTYEITELGRIELETYAKQLEKEKTNRFRFWYASIVSTIALVVSILVAIFK